MQNKLRTASIRKGLLGGSRFWLGIFASRMLMRALAKVAKKSDMSLDYSQKLPPGKSLLIKHINHK